MEEDLENLEVYHWHCDICSIDFSSETDYNSHMLVMEHQKIQAVVESSEQEMEMEQEMKADDDVTPSEVDTERNYDGDTEDKDCDADQDKKTQPKRDPNLPKPEFFCKLCKSQSSSQNDFDQHINGNKHKENIRRRNAGERVITGTLNKKTNKYRSRLQVLADSTVEPCVGLEFMKEYQMEDRDMEERYICELCEFKLVPRNVMSHILSFNHRIKYLKRCHPDLHKQVQNDVIPKKSDKVPVVKRFCEEIEEKYGRKRVNVKVELDPFFDIRQQHKRAAAAGPMGPTAKFARMDLGGRGRGMMGVPPAVIPPLEHDGLYSEYEARLAHQVARSLNDAILNVKLATGGMDSGLSSYSGRTPMGPRPPVPRPPGGFNSRISMGSGRYGGSDRGYGGWGVDRGRGRANRPPRPSGYPMF